MNIHIQNGRLIDPANQIDARQDIFIAEGKTLTLVATDGHRLALAQAQLENDIPKQEVILPRKTVLELMRHGEIGSHYLLAEVDTTPRSE